MPPVKPVTRLATPWPQPSRVLFEWVSVMSSTSFAVISDSSSPTSAMASENGAMIDSVSSVNGTSGMRNDGSEDGRSPSSPTSGTASANTTVMTVSSTIATSGAGTIVVSFGRKNMMTRPAATIG